MACMSAKIFRNLPSRGPEQFPVVLTQEQKQDRAKWRDQRESDGQRMLAAAVPFSTTCADLKYMGTRSLEGSLWQATIVCRLTKLNACFGIGRKSDFQGTYRHFLEYVKNQYGSYPKIFLTDNDKVFVNKATKSVNLELGIRKETTAPYVSVQNPVAERFQRTSGEAINSMLYQGRLPPDFWEQIQATFCFIKNRLPTQSLYDQAPLQLASSQLQHSPALELRSLFVPGCYAAVYNHTARKMFNKAIPAIYLGPAVYAMSGQKASRFYRIDGEILPLKKSNLIVSSSFTVDESVYPGSKLFAHLLHFQPTDYSNLSDELPPSLPDLTLERFESISSAPEVLPEPECEVLPSSFSPSLSTRRDLSSELSPISLEQSRTDSPLPVSEEMKTTATSFLPASEEKRTTAVSQSCPESSVPLSPTEQKYEVEAILGRRRVTKKGSDRGSWSYQVKFKGYPGTTSIPERNFVDKDMLAEFKQQHTRAKGVKLSLPAISEEVDPSVDNDKKVEPSSSVGNVEKTEFTPSTDVDSGESSASADVDSGESSVSSPDVEFGACSVPSCSPTETLSSGSLLQSVAKFINVFIFCQLASVAQPTGLLGAQIVAAFSTGVSGCYDDGHKVPDWRLIQVPKSHDAVLKSPQRDLWLAAEQAELDAIAANRTWTWFPTWKVKKKGKNPITLTWVYKLKPPTTLQRDPIYKARLVAHGYKQTLHVDYEQTFAQVATMKAFRVLLWISSYLVLFCTQMDVSNAFLSADIDAEVYVYPPPGYPSAGCFKLNKCLYGLKQAPRLFYRTLAATLLSAGLQPLVTDSCVFKFREGTRVCFVLIFVDDIVIATNCENLRKKVETALSDRFKMKNLGELKHFVGIRVHQSTQGIKISQSEYIQKILEHFRMDSCNPAPLPQQSSIKLSCRTGGPKDEAERAAMERVPYRQLVGSLLYLFGTVPEICFSVILLSSFVANPGQAHWAAALFVLRYLQGAMKNELVFPLNQKPVITAFSDSDWGNNVDHRRSVSGYIIYLGTTPIIWKSKYQKGAQSLSSCEAEYRAMAACCKDLRWLAQHLSELGIDFPQPINLYCDSDAARALAANPTNHDRSKHIDIEYHFLREYIEEGFIKLCPIDSKDNPADLFTKAVNRHTFHSLIESVYQLPERFQ